MDEAAVGGRLPQALPGVVMMLLIGAGLLASTVMPLPRWARLRGRQMDDIAAALAEPEDLAP